MITRRFVFLAKYHMGSLGFTPRVIGEFSYSRLNAQTTNMLLRLKNIKEDAFSVYYHYSWIIKHWEKVRKAFSHKNWASEPYFEPKITTVKTERRNVCLLTNIFTKKIVGFYFDERGNIWMNDLSDRVPDDFRILETVDSDLSCVFHTSYLKSLKRREKVDSNAAIATIYTRSLDFDKQKYVSYVFPRTERVPLSTLLCIAKERIGNEMKEIARMKSYRNYILWSSLRR